MNWQGDEWTINKDDVPVDEASFRYSDYVSYAKDKILATLSGLGLYQNINWDVLGLDTTLLKT